VLTPHFLAKKSEWGTLLYCEPELNCFSGLYPIFDIIVSVLNGGCGLCYEGYCSYSLYLCKFCLFLFFQNLKAQDVQCSVIALATEVHVCHKLCHETGGLFGVILDDSHFQDQLLQHIDPPPAATFLDSSLIKIGFPYHMMQEGKEAPLALCMW